MSAHEPDPRCVTFVVGGMSCASCAARIERVLGQVSGVTEASVSYAARLLEVRYEPGAVEVETLAEAVRDAGYEATLAAEEPRREDTEGRWLHVRLAVAVFFWMNAMLPQLVVYLGVDGRSEPSTAWWLSAASGALTLPVVLFSGWPFLARAAASLRAGAPGMDLLVASGAVTTYAYSVLTLASGSAAVYFDTAAGIITLLLVGRVIEHHARRRSLDAVWLLRRLSPDVAHVVEAGGRVSERKTPTVPEGARILVRAGERAPLDGLVESGSGYVDRSLLTGESSPVAIEAGSFVEAGSLSLDGSLVLVVDRVVGSRALDRIAASVDGLLSRRAPTQALADRWASKLTVAVLAISVLTGIVTWLTWRDPSRAVARAVAVAVVACPCALGLATPMAVLVAAGRAARRGILFRDGDAIERAAAVTAVLFDKTGTLTVGRPTVARVISAPGREPADVLAVAATLERGSSHPLARAILEAASDAPLLTVRETHTEPGMGVRGRDASGGELRVGTRAFVEAGGARVLDEPRDLGTHAYVAAGGAWVGTIVATDTLREDASQAVARLRRGGIRVGMVSGDREPVARDVARRVGVQEVHAQCSPAEKAEIVARARRDGEGVAFVGDGLNDGPALAAADLGVAVVGATDLAQAAAALTLRAGGLARLTQAVELARVTRRVMRQNLLWALGYNLVAIPAAALGILSPTWAALSMAASSLSVVASSLRLRTMTPIPS